MKIFKSKSGKGGSGADSDKGFDAALEELEKRGGANKLEKELEMAYAHESVKSAVWWIENVPKKPHSANIDDVLLLHEKYKRSLELGPVYSKNYDKLMARFVDAALPDIDYKAKGFKSKAHCFSRMEISYGTTAMEVDDYDIYKDYGSPFITPFYWFLYNDVVAAVADLGLLLRVKDCEDYIRWRDALLEECKRRNCLELDISLSE